MGGQSMSKTMTRFLIQSTGTLGVFRRLKEPQQMGDAPGAQALPLGIKVSQAGIKEVNGEYHYSPSANGTPRFKHAERDFWLRTGPGRRKLWWLTKGSCGELKFYLYRTGVKTAPPSEAELSADW